MSDLCLLAALAASQAKQQAQALSEALVPPLTETAESRNNCRGEVDLAIASIAFSQDSVQEMAVERQNPEFSAPQAHEDEGQMTAEQPAAARSPASLLHFEPAHSEQDDFEQGYSEQAHSEQDDAARVVPTAAELLRYPARSDLAQSLQNQTQKQEKLDRVVPDSVQNSAQNLVQNSVRDSVQSSTQTIQNTTPPAPPMQRDDRPQSLLPSIADPSLAVPALPQVAWPARSSISSPDAIHPVPDSTRDASAVSAMPSSRSSHSTLAPARNDSANPNSAGESWPIAADAYSPSSPTVLNSTQWSGETTTAFESGAGSSDARSPLLARIALPQTKAVRPASGSQFFRQRWAALQAGRSYTRLDSDSFAQQWLNATYQPSHEDWVSLLAQEANAMSRGQGNNRLTILLGDSISLWFPSDYMARYRFWLNQSISGDTAAGTIQRLSLFSRTRPDTIHVMLGINDLRRGVSDAQLLNDQRYIMRRLRQQHPQAQIVVHSILPTRLNNLLSDRIQPINQQLKAIAQQESVQFLDLQPYFADAEGNLRTDLTTDGLHLNPQGYAMWYRVLSHFRLV